MDNSLARRLSAVVAVVVTCLLPCATRAQEPVEAPAAAYIEVGGAGLFYSLNYEGRFSDHLTARLGFTFLNMTVFSEESGEDSQIAVTLLPVMMNVLVGRGNSRLEIGAGPLVAVTGSGINRVDRGPASVEFSDDLSLAGVTSAVGYRYHRPEGGLLFRATVTPFYSGRAQVWGGLSLGWAM
ncbi:MAG TPA: hypothetical protein VK928_05185 [Longimicrobiales bacterium]|nr:hypothetical protein [Longimicrobiales bacterium]